MHLKFRLYDICALLFKLVTSQVKIENKLCKNNNYFISLSFTVFVRVSLLMKLRLGVIYYNSHQPPREIQFPSKTGNEQQLKVKTTAD